MTATYGLECLIYSFPYFYQSGLMLFFKTKRSNLVSGKQIPLDSWNGSSCTSYCFFYSAWRSLPMLSQAFR